ncbi:MAG: undecaprenyl-diphosphate phosphatase [Puniceicoccales bacterium]|jgi:undecaprenyl-diphosphatase|nr:undecaprenyl-diphosphate phosphatase [Puniceicoccales bacterium]
MGKKISFFIFSCALLCSIPGHGSPLGMGESVLRGAVQGVTEFLPISSSAHLLLLESVLDENFSERSASFWHYHLLLQFASVLPIFAFYRQRMMQLLRGFLGRSKTGLFLLGKLLLAFFPTAISGAFFGGRRTDVHYCALPLLLGGVAILIFEYFHKKRGTKSLEELSTISALCIGLLQCLALIPGVSRLLVSLLGAMSVGLSPGAAVEFSFLLGTGTICAATTYDLCFGSMWSALQLFPSASVFCGITASFLCASLVIPTFLRWLRHHSLRPFAIYRITLGAILLF